MPSDVVICACGAVTPLGLTAAQSAASVRSGLSAFSETSIMDRSFEPLVMALVPDEDLPPPDDRFVGENALTFRQQRMMRLLKMAVGEVQLQIPKIPGCHVFVGLPEAAPDDTSLQTFRKALSGWLAGYPVAAQVVLVNGGRAGGQMAVHEAAQSISRGRCAVALVCGADTYLDLALLGQLDMEKRLNRANVADGFTPGEGAACLLLASAAEARRLNLPVLADLVATSVGQEPGHMYSREPYRGDGLSGAFDLLLRNGATLARKVPTVFSSMNGENHFAKEWSVAFMRHRDHIEEDFRIEHPADCLGDTGAACGPIMLALSCVGLQKGYLVGPVLVYASSDRAPRAACVIGAPK